VGLPRGSVRTGPRALVVTKGYQKSHYKVNSRYLSITYRLHYRQCYDAYMKRPRRTHAQVVHDSRAEHARTLAAPVAALRAARRAQRPFSMSSGRLARRYLDQGMSVANIARQLQWLGYRTPRGGLVWSATQVERELTRRDIEEVRRRVPSIGRRGNRMVRVPRFRAGEAREGGEIRAYGIDLARDRWEQAWVWPLIDSDHAGTDEDARAYESNPAAYDRPPEPMMDERGRVLTGRRLSRLKGA
jgi:hypothetical protein